MTAITSAVLFRSESKGSGFHANERPEARELEHVLIHATSCMLRLIQPTQIRAEFSNFEHGGLLLKSCYGADK